MDDVKTLQAFAEAQNLEFPLLSDPDGSLAGKYRVLYSGRPMARRVTFLVDPLGLIRHIDTEVKLATHGSDMLALVKKLQESDGR
jgi:peroxiredoxin Q/BCP